MVAQLALGLKEEWEFRQATETLVHKYPDQMATHYFNAIRLALDEDWIAAEDEIKKAERMGLPAQAVQGFLTSGVHTRATAWRWAHYVLYLVAAWACGRFILFIVGKAFSTLTLHFIESTDPNSSASGRETVLRRNYRWLIVCHTELPQLVAYPVTPSRREGSKRPRSFLAFQVRYPIHPRVLRQHTRPALAVSAAVSGW